MPTREKRPTQAGEYARELRKARGLSMRDAAKLLDVHWTLISQWEHGQTRIEKHHCWLFELHLGADQKRMRELLDDDARAG